MRLWTVHPRYLDAAGLVAAWREALLAQKVLFGQTKGYRNHPQLERFRSHSKPEIVIGVFLSGLADEADARGYRFDRTKILHCERVARIPETTGQLHYEWGHLNRKLKNRDVERYKKYRGIEMPDPHPLFRIIPGGIRSWEIIAPRGSAG